jgi:hypothetical protein
MNNRPETENPGDGELARRFRQLRQEDAAKAPSFPSQEQFKLRPPVDTATAFSGVAWKMAVAASVVAVTVALVIKPAQQDPGALYANIMSANNMATDSLLSVSQSTLPAMLSLPEVLELDVSAFAWPNTK